MQQHLPVDGEGVILLINPIHVDAKEIDLSLSNREKVVLGHLVKGKQDKEIAKCLHVNETTVHTHVKQILKKLGASNRTEAAVKAVKTGLF